MTSPSISRLFEEATAAHKAGRWSDAEKGYIGLLAIDPRRPEVNANFGQMLIQRGRAEAGVERLAAATESAPAVSRFWTLLAEGMLVLGQDRRARRRPAGETMACFRRAIAIDPGFTAAYVDLGEALRSEGQAMAAITLSLCGGRLAPNDARLSSQTERARLLALYQQQTRFVLDLHGSIGPNDISGMAQRIAGRLADVWTYFDATIERFGPTHHGISAADSAYHHRSLQLMADFLPGASGDWTVNDIGCGYAALFDRIQDRLLPYGVRYHGYDISPRMIDQARRRFGTDPRAVFAVSAIPVWPADYSIAAGVFNLNCDHDPEEWLVYVQSQILLMARISRIAFSFNALLPEHGCLFRIRPEVILDFVRERISRRIEVLTGYSDVQEWTVRVFAPFDPPLPVGSDS